MTTTPGMKHTKSPSGRVHRLTGIDGYVEKRYHSAPRFDDQVQGDLVREYSVEYGAVTVGILPVRIDPALDERSFAKSLPYLQGYLEALETAKGARPRELDALITQVRNRIADLKEI